MKVKGHMKPITEGFKLEVHTKERNLYDFDLTIDCSDKNDLIDEGFFDTLNGVLSLKFLLKLVLVK